MPLDQYNNLGSLVEPDRVHKACYADEQVFEKELENIFYKSWIYMATRARCLTRVTTGPPGSARERMILCRGENGDVNVLYNRCPHRGALICNNLNGNAPRAFRCPYHAWQFNMDGSLRNVPMKQGYEGVIDLTDPQLQMKRAERQETYRGFIFASLSEEGPSLEEWLGQGQRQLSMISVTALPKANAR